MVIKWHTGKIATILKEVEGLKIPPDGFKRELDGVIDIISSDKGCEVLDGELSYMMG